MRARPRVIPALALFVTVAVGCGSDAAPAAGADAAPPTGADPGLAEIFGFAPEPEEGSPSVVILYPRQPTDIPVPSEPAVMDQYGRDFIPRLLPIRLGQPVQFKNSEDDLHTVHVKDESGASLFNVAMPIRGGLHDHTFTEPGDYAVSCEAHQEMAATILVVTTPFSVVADREGAFWLSAVPPGTYDLVLRRGGQRHEQVVELRAGRNELRLAFPATD